MKIKKYSELRRLNNFEDRFDYLSLRGIVGERTFGFERYVNQAFYTSKQWRDIRHHVIARDLGCDLGVADHEIYDKIIIHHMNPMTVEDIEHGNTSTLDPEFLITTTHRTHNAIHYGDKSLLPSKLIARVPGDTKLW